MYGISVSSVVTLQALYHHTSPTGHPPCTLAPSVHSHVLREIFHSITMGGYGSTRGRASARGDILEREREEGL